MSSHKEALGELWRYISCKPAQEEFLIENVDVKGIIPRVTMLLTVYQAAYWIVC